MRELWRNKAMGLGSIVAWIQRTRNTQAIKLPSCNEARHRVFTHGNKGACQSSSGAPPDPPGADPDVHSLRLLAELSPDFFRLS